MCLPYLKELILAEVGIEACTILIVLINLLIRNIAEWAISKIGYDS